MIGRIESCHTLSVTHQSRKHTPYSHRASCGARVFSAIAQLAAVTALLTLSFISGFAQSTATGTIVGTVTDPSGAVVPDATVMIVDRSTNTTTKTTTNTAGHYVFVNVNPGTYDIKITKQGFQTANIQGQTVEVGKSLTEDVKLPLGSVAQEITVETTGTELQTMNATVGNTVTGIALESLPSLGRDVSTFATLQPGVSPDGSVAGAVVDQSTFQLDGGNNTNDMDGSMQVYTPSFAGDPTGGIVANQIGGAPTGVMPTPADSVEEFKVNTANQTADFNNSSGAQIQVVTKRGTNSVHGTVYEYYFDNNFSANTWDNKLAGTPQPDYHYSRFGAALGGPIIPKEILGGKTYMFGNYQGFRWPNSTTIEKTVPSANLRNGIITFKGTQYNLKALDPRGIGIDPIVQQMWNKYMPLPNDPSCGPLLGSRCDGLNGQGFKANVASPQNDNFGVARLDHDFGSKWHFNTSYRYYKLTRAVTSQVDIGGFFPNDKLGVPTSVANRPQQPWYYVAGLTTNISSNVTNDFHYSYLRNYWAWATKAAPPQISGLGGAMEPLGESSTGVLSPYNVNAQSVRTRFWDGHDNFFRDDITMLHGNHLFQFGGQYQRNWNYHQRTDNGGGINYTPTYQLGDGAGAGLVDMSLLGGPSSNTFNRFAAAALGIVTDSQVAFTRTGANLSLNPPLTPAFDQSTIPYYNVYFSDSWHMKPTFTLTYGLGWTLEMPPVEANGKQVELVDSSAQPIDIEKYLSARQQAALQGQVYNPTVGFALIGNTAGKPKYPYNPFYKSFSPRVAVAWNPHANEGWMGDMFGEDKTVIRAGYGRIYGRLNGVDLVLVPLLGTGLIQPVQCRTANRNGTCTGPVDVWNAFRIGIDGNTAPLGFAAPTLPQPDFPGINDLSTAAGEALDPNFRPNVVDSVDVTVQRQISNKITMELGYIGRIIHHEYQPININAVPYMMTKGGQQFQQAYANIERALGCATSAAACGANVPGTAAAQKAYANTFAPQPFFEAALSGTGFCNGYTSCTAAVVDQEMGNLTSQAVWSLWSDLDNGAFNFPRSMLNTPLASTAPCPGSPDPTPCGASGQLTSGVGVNASVGHGNYHAGFVSLKMSDWHGLTAQQNFTWSKALGTGAFVQATSEYTVDDPFDLDKMYGVQNFDRKFIYNLFMVYQPPFFKNQPGVVGHLLGGWTLAPIFTAGTGQPVPCQTLTGDYGSLGLSGAQGFGAGDGLNFGDNENCVLTNTAGLSSAAHYGVAGSNGIGTTVATSASGAPAPVNMFANPALVYSEVRSPILGIDSRAGGTGPVRGLPYWNLDMSVRKQFRITERVSTEFQAVFTNVLNHLQFYDPIPLDLQNPDTWGVLNAQGNNPRQMEFGLRVSW